ncbi:zinc finger AN1 and C2H2 domain-containing stress-associated protein 16-like [Phoenix dactylifera]|uniref:Zinc finger AN1 and C2H2 domain-containing stress-associated protein 16-like n=1 Tax=Phoenix dactylifera TaxID=42345 RepID=A0A8B8ZCD5_PHODC|nr:zinc finger AN1 and C2H2 domain-containing stress-associated protein 16-like [Phoenix dactylifera]XP_038971755.1 zinc finger AN1 and C2H2 domain-containing stress-associated protein 16-like [Phoenix dactylifera]XP_038971756.1 zinc finger AN1 and C2H2 domain-containing stress-associated protein 16-like [Phoenix dactylifera]
MGTPEFPDLGKHCSVEDCRQIDFLPFTCDRCRKVFCLEHRSYTKHLCPNANQQDVTVLVCPLCAKGVHLVPDEDPNITWESHVNLDCDPSNYQKTTKKKRCPIPGCKETLTFSNTIRCRDCTKEHCLKHRFGPDHKCPGPKKPVSGFPFVGLLNRSQKRESLSKNSSNGTSWWSSSLLTAASSLRASAEAGMQRLSNATTQALQKAKDGTSPGGSGALVEQCTQCPAKFSTISALIEHAEKSHHRSTQPGCARVTIDACPICSKGFRDPVLLVEHVERDHGGSSIA